MDRAPVSVVLDREAVAVLVLFLNDHCDLWDYAVDIAQLPHRHHYRTPKAVKVMNHQVIVICRPPPVLDDATHASALYLEGKCVGDGIGVAVVRLFGMAADSTNRYSTTVQIYKYSHCMSLVSWSPPPTIRSADGCSASIDSTVVQQ